MKNIHILPTDKPSRLWVNNLRRRLEFEKDDLIGSNTAKHIYITSDEEIKEGDYVLYHEDKISQVLGINIDELKLDKGGVWRSSCKKIILTTDQDLIKDGVQAIDDEFLKWFVKNSSCEKVKIADYGNVLFDNKVFHMYKIIIPKEELNLNCFDCNESLEDCTCMEDTINMKQETLEQAAEKSFNDSEYLYDRPKYTLGFIEGAKWQQERIDNEIEKQIKLTELRGEKIVKYLEKYKGQSIYNEIAFAIEFGYQLRLEEDE